MPRITQSMLHRQSLDDIRRNLLGSTSLQSSIASGVRVSRPSDDPNAMLRILPLRNEIQALDQSLSNLGLARGSLDTATAALEDASEIMQRVRELTVQGANGALSNGDRVSIASEIDQVLGQMVAVANSSRAGRFIFGGTATESAPFELVNGSNGTTVRYLGNDRRVSVEVAPSVDTDLNLPGDSIFRNHQRGATTFEGTTGAKSGNGIDSGVGVDNLEVTFAGLTVPPAVTGIAAGPGTTTALGVMDYTFTAPDQLSINGGPPQTVTTGDNTVQVANRGQISLTLNLPISPTTGSFTSRANLSIDGGATTTGVDFTSNNVRVSDSSDDSQLNVDVSALLAVGEERVRYEGTFDAFSTLISIRDILRNEDGLDQATVGSRLTQSLGDIDNAHDNVLAGLRDLGFRSSNMSLLQSRVEGLKANAAESLSIERDTDIVSAIVEFNQRDTLYQASLNVSARIIQTSLLNFLR